MGNVRTFAQISNLRQGFARALATVAVAFLGRGSMSIVRRIASALLVLHCVASLSAFAQVSAALSGRVTDQSGAVIQGASVTATDTDTAVGRSTVTDAAGRYELLALPLGHYELIVQKSGF